MEYSMLGCRLVLGGGGGTVAPYIREHNYVQLETRYSLDNKI